MLLKLDPQVCSSRRLLSSALRAYAVHLPPGTPFPSESTLRREFGISRMTLNRALNDLVAEGILYNRRGAGRFAAEKDICRVYFVLPFLEKRRDDLSNGSIVKDIFDELQILAQEKNISLTPLVASLTNRRDELDLEVFRLLPDGANVILPGYWYSGLFDLLQAKKTGTAVFLICYRRKSVKSFSFPCRQVSVFFTKNRFPAGSGWSMI